MLDHDIYTILEFSDLLYHAVLYRAISLEISTLESKLSAVRLALNGLMLNHYLNTVNETNSMYCALSQHQTTRNRIRRRSGYREGSVA